MKILLNQFSLADIQDKDFDVSIVASGFEKRASYQGQQLAGRINKKIALGFANNSDDVIRKENDKILRDHGYTIEVGGEEHLEESSIDTLFEELNKEYSGKSLTMHIDYSSMSRNWYARILLHCKKLSERVELKLYFGYSFALHEKGIKDEKLNQIVEPIYGYCKLSVPHKPTAVIICLGNEFSRVYGLKEYFDAATYIFYSDTKFGNLFSIEVETVNEELLLSTPPEQKFKYPIEDLPFTDQLIENLCKALMEKYRVIIAPCGPKPFTLLAMINSIKLNNDIEVWRISPGSDIQKINRQPSGVVSFLEVIMCH